MYTLYNKELNRFLKHPKDGIWASEDYEEAQTLLESAREYVKSVGVPEIADKLVVVEITIDQIKEQIT
jgi:hypothetical protein